MKNLLRLIVLAICWTWGTGAVQACSCEPISAQAGFDHAQYVFTGKVVQAEQHVWIVEIERVWKGHEKLRRTVKLMDVYARMDCEFFKCVEKTFVEMRIAVNYIVYYGR